MFCQQQHLLLLILCAKTEQKKQRQDIQFFLLLSFFFGSYKKYDSKYQQSKCHQQPCFITLQTAINSNFYGSQDQNWYITNQPQSIIQSIMQQQEIERLEELHQEGRARPIDQDSTKPLPSVHDPIDVRNNIIPEHENLVEVENVSTHSVEDQADIAEHHHHRQHNNIENTIPQNSHHKPLIKRLSDLEVKSDTLKIQQDNDLSKSRTRKHQQEQDVFYQGQTISQQAKRKELQFEEGRRQRQRLEGNSSVGKKVAISAVSCAVVGIVCGVLLKDRTISTILGLTALASSYILQK